METNSKGHKILRTEGQFNLCEDTSAGYPTYYIENTILVKYTKGKGVSYNFEEEKKRELMQRDRSRFVKFAKQSAGNDINCEEVAKNLWAELGDIPVNEEDELDENFFTHTGMMFERGTDKFEVWHWFEDVFGVSVAKDLMNLP
jgi:hypothetical protein